MKSGGQWERIRLGDVVEAKYGKALPESRREAGSVPVYGSNGVVGTHDRAITRGPTIIIGRKGSSGAINFSPVPCWPIDTAYFIDDPGPFAIQFLDYLLRSLGLTELDRSTAIPGLNREQLYDIRVPLPPISEQCSVAALYGRIEGKRSSASQHLARACITVARARQAVLAFACSGSLTADWRTESPALERVRVPEAQARSRGRGDLRRNSHAELGDLPSSWVQAPLGHLLAEIKYGTSQKSEYGITGVPILRIPNVSGRRLDTTDIKKANLSQMEATTLRLRLGDLLMIRSNGSVQLVGKTLPVTEDAVDMAYAGYLMRLRTVDDLLYHRYLALAMASPQIRRQIEMQARSTSGVNNINTGEVCGLMIPLPSLSEQVEIVKRVDRLASALDTVEHRIDDAANHLELFADSALAKVVQGGTRLACAS